MNQSGPSQPSPSGHSVSLVALVLNLLCYTWLTLSLRIILE